jgi:hypothetical protein
VYENLDAIVAFVAKMKGIRIPREAIAHIDTEVKERDRLTFLGRVAAHAGGRGSAIGSGMESTPSAR